MVNYQKKDDKQIKVKSPPNIFTQMEVKLMSLLIKWLSSLNTDWKTLSTKN